MRIGQVKDELISREGRRGTPGDLADLLDGMNPPQREMDMLLATGEQVSIALLSMALHAQGVPGSHVILRTGGKPELVPRAVLEKAAALAAVLEGPRDPEQWPAQRIRPAAGSAGGAR